mgnify:CR=1 FL=1
MAAFGVPLSILVVLDVVLEGGSTIAKSNCLFSFNPCCAGCSSGREVERAKGAAEAIFQSLLCWM